MVLKNKPTLPVTYGDVVKKYDEGRVYDAYTIEDDYSIKQIKGKVISNDSWNYHNNYDDSELELYVSYGGNYIRKWFTTDIMEAIEIQHSEIEKYQLELISEINRVKSITHV